MTPPCHTRSRARDFSVVGVRRRVDRFARRRSGLHAVAILVAAARRRGRWAVGARRARLGADHHVHDHLALVVGRVGAVGVRRAGLAETAAAAVAARAGAASAGAAAARPLELPLLEPLELALPELEPLELALPLLLPLLEPPLLEPLELPELLPVASSPPPELEPLPPPVPPDELEHAMGMPMANSVEPPRRTKVRTSFMPPRMTGPKRENRHFRQPWRDVSPVFTPCHNLGRRWTSRGRSPSKVDHVHVHVVALRRRR